MMRIVVDGTAETVTILDCNKVLYSGKEFPQSGHIWAILLKEFGVECSVEETGQDETYIQPYDPFDPDQKGFLYD